MRADGKLDVVSRILPLSRLDGRGRHIAFFPTESIMRVSSHFELSEISAIVVLLVPGT